MEDAAADAQLLYDFLRMPTSPPPTKADAILVLGSNDVRVAKRAAELHAAGLAPLVVFSGARGNFTQDLEQTEAEWLEGRAAAIAPVNLGGYEVLVDLGDSRWGFTLQPATNDGRRVWHLRATSESARYEWSRRLVLATLTSEN